MAPVSKCDQQGFGVRRALRCCGTTLIMEAKSKGMFGDAWLFRDCRGAVTTKTGVIKKSKKAYGDRITGHSPRRSGAMFYVRQGLPIQELAFLERWNSSVVLQYAEEALQEKAVQLPQCAPWTPMTLAPLTPAPVTPAIQAVANPGTPAPTPPESQDQSFASVFNKPGDLWVVTKGRGWKNRPKHWITKATWSLPIKAWSTACGWHFASQSADFYFLTGRQVDEPKCNKCSKLW